MLTPKEQIFLDKISKNENIKLLIDRLGLEPVVSEDFRKSTMVSARINELIETFQIKQKQPAKTRTVFKLNDPFGLDGPFTKPETITAYLETIYPAMEIPTALRTLLKITAYTVILLATLICGYTGAPVAQPSPPASQIGKVDVQDRGGSFPGLEVFKHNVLFPIRDNNKLFPSLGPGTDPLRLHGQTKEYLATRVKRRII